MDGGSEYSLRRMRVPGGAGDPWVLCYSANTIWAPTSSQRRTGRKNYVRTAAACCELENETNKTQGGLGVDGDNSPQSTPAPLHYLHHPMKFSLQIYKLLYMIFTDILTLIFYSTISWEREKEGRWMSGWEMKSCGFIAGSEFWELPRTSKENVCRLHGVRLAASEESKW